MTIPITPLRELASITDLVGSTRINGIPTVFAPREGQIAAGLLFRVGRMDETLASSGITHLLEHLALFRQTMTDVHHNGETGDIYTHFHVVGDRAAVVSYLNEVCAALQDLPLHRMEMEKEILRTEAARGSSDGLRSHRIERYGAMGAGLVGHGELGLASITAEQLREWSRTRFNSGNVVLWSTTDGPLEGLQLTLPAGQWHPIPRHPEVLSVKPAFYQGAPGGILIDSIVPRSTAASVFSRVASRALFRALRQEGGYSYSAECVYEPVDAQHTRISIYADALPKQQAAVVGATIDVLAALRAGMIEESDMVNVRSMVRQQLEVPSPGSAMLPSIALDLITGAEILHPTQFLKQVDAVTPAEVAEVAELVWQDALAQVPEGSLDWAGFALAPRFSAGVVTGEWYPLIGEKGPGLTIGPDGVSVTTQHGSATVRFVDCVAYLTVPDGARVLIGADAFRISVEPTLFEGVDAAVIARLDSRIPAHVVLPQPARPAENIPQPENPPKKKPTAQTVNQGNGKWRGFGVWAALLSVPLAVLSVVLAFLTRADMAYLRTPNDRGDLTTIPHLAIEWAITAACFALTWILLAGVRARRKWNTGS